MHLVIVSPFPPTITGIGQYGYHVTRALATSGMFSRLTVLAGSHRTGTSPNHLGLTELDYCWAPGQSEARSTILSRVKGLKPDLVWFNAGASIFGRSPWLNLSGLLTPMLVQRMGIPTVVTLHELVELTDLRTLNAPGGPFAKWGARFLTSITSQADLVCMTMKNYAERLSSRGVDCMYIPIGAYHEPQLLAESVSQEILFFTTLAPFKGLELLLEAFHRLRSDYPKLKLTIAGSDHVRFPEYAGELKSRFGNADGIRWLGQTPEDEVMSLFQRAQIVALPYTASTGSSSVLYQAATWGRPVVASDLRDIEKLAADNDLQVQFYRNGNIESLCAALRTLVDSKATRQSQAAHNFRVMQHHRPEDTCRKYIQAFNRALEKRCSPTRITLPIPEQEPA